MRVLYAIPSRGRANDLSTLDALTLGRRKEIHVFVYEKELAAYAHAESHGCAVRPCPAGVNNIGKKRQYIIEDAQRAGYTHVVMLDDDLVFAKRRTDEPDKFETMLPKDFVEMFRDLERALMLHAHAGICSREGGNRLPPDHVLNTRMQRVLGYDLSCYAASGARYDRMELMEDFDVTLTMLRAGMSNVVLTDYCHNQRSSNAPGGCSTYRTLEKQAAAARKLAKLHPGFVKVVEKTTKTAWNGATRTDVQVAWKKAFRSSQK